MMCGLAERAHHGDHLIDNQQHGVEALPTRTLEEKCGIIEPNGKFTAFYFLHLGNRPSCVAANVSLPQEWQPDLTVNLENVTRAL
jgi:hypothetical protein